MGISEKYKFKIPTQVLEDFFNNPIALPVYSISNYNFLTVLLNGQENCSLAYTGITDYPEWSNIDRVGAIRKLRPPLIYCHHSVYVEYLSYIQVSFYLLQMSPINSFYLRTKYVPIVLLQLKSFTNSNFIHFGAQKRKSPLSKALSPFLRKIILHTKLQSLDYSNPVDDSET